MCRLDLRSDRWWRTSAKIRVELALKEYGEERVACQEGASRVKEGEEKKEKAYWIHDAVRIHYEKRGG
jgi:hypothetical protein